MVGVEMNSTEVCVELCVLLPLSILFLPYRMGKVYLWRKPDYSIKPLNCRKSLTNITTQIALSELCYAGVSTIRSH